MRSMPLSRAQLGGTLFCKLAEQACNGSLQLSEEYIRLCFHISIYFVMNNKNGLLMLSIFIVGCGSAAISSSSKKIFPLEIGNTFITQKDYFDLKTGIHYLTKTDTLKIIDKEISENEDFFFTNTKQVIIKRPDGYWIKDNSSKKTEAILTVKYPGNIGDTYSPYVKPTMEKNSTGKLSPDTIVGNWEILAKDQKITVPAGTFNCIEYRSDHKSLLTGKVHFRFLAWWSPGYGMIRNENYYHKEDETLLLIYREELLHEELK